jgi:chondroitin 4-sulfotransferase 11
MLQGLKKAFKAKRRVLRRKIHTFPLWYKEPDFIFIHINKTGGSSIEKALNLPFEHLTATEKKQEVGPEKWQNKFKFAFVRNPFDKVCSHYRYRVKTNQTKLKEHPLSFAEWVKISYLEQDPFYFDNPRMFMPQTWWLQDKQGELMVDQIYHFENLHDDFKALCSRLNIAAELPHLKASKKVDYRRFYDDATQEIVTSHFKNDLKQFNYQF